MPADYTHYIFSDKIIKKGAKEIANIGSQGPDPLFFYGILSFRKNKKEVRKLGHQMHKNSPVEMFNYMLKYAANETNKTKREILFSFIKGQMYHYILDKTVHPYVLAITNYDKKKTSNKESFKQHHVVESNMDVMIAKTFEYNLNPKIVYDVPVVDLKLVSTMFSSMVKEIYKLDCFDDNTYANAVNDTRRIRNILYSKNGKKKKFFDIFFKGTKISSTSHPIEVKEDYKPICFNEERTLWIDPQSGKKRYESVLELFENAKYTSLIADEIIKKAMKKIDIKPDLIELVSKTDYYGLKILNK